MTTDRETKTPVNVLEPRIGYSTKLRGIYTVFGDKAKDFTNQDRRPGLTRKRERRRKG